VFIDVLPAELFERSESLLLKMSESLIWEEFIIDELLVMSLRARLDVLVDD